MARKDTFLKTSLSIKSNEKASNIDNVKSVKDAVSPNKEVKDIKKSAPKQKEDKSDRNTNTSSNNIEVNVNALFKKQKTLGVRTTKTVRVYEELNAILEKLTRDPKTNKTLPSSHGFISKIVNNGIIKELVGLGVIDKSYLDYIEDYY